MKNIKLLLIGEKFDLETEGDSIVGEYHISEQDGCDPFAPNSIIISKEGPTYFKVEIFDVTLNYHEVESQFWGGQHLSASLRISKMLHSLKRALNKHSELPELDNVILDDGNMGTFRFFIQTDSISDIDQKLHQIYVDASDGFEEEAD